MHIHRICLLISFLFLFQWLPFQAHAFSPASSAGQLEEEIIELINQYRQKKNLSPLVANNTLNRLARKHSKDMAAGRRPFGHDGAEQRFRTAGKEINKLSAFWENVAFGYSSAEGVVKGWINSPGHRKNMESKATIVGVGVASDKNGRLYFTALFARVG